MNADALRFKRLWVSECRGFEHGGFELGNLHDGINLVCGPNASGKSTIVELLQRALWDETAPARDRFSVELTTPEGCWEVEFSGGRRTVLREGRPAELPNLPPRNESDRYRLSLAELLRDTNRGGDRFAETIAREVAGGYNLDAARDELNFITRSPRTPSAKKLRQFDAAVREAEGQQRELAAEERELAELKRRRERAREAGVEAYHLEKALVCADLLAERESVDTALEALPELIARLHGGEDERLADLDAKIATEEETLAEAREQLEEARATLAELELPEEGLPQSRRNELDTALQELRGLKTRLEQAESDRERAEAGLEEAGKSLPEGFDAESVEKLKSNTLIVIERAADKLEQAEAAVHAACAELNRLGEREEETDSEPLITSASALADWLKERPDSHRRQHLFLGTAGGLLLAGTVVAAVLWSLWLIAPGAALLAGLGLIARWLRARPDTSTERTRRKFEQLRVEPPAAWTPAAVGERIRSLQTEIQQANRVTEHNRRIEDAHARVQDAKKAAEEARDDFDSTLSEAGLASVEGPASALHLARTVSEWQRRSCDLSEARAGETGLQKKLEADLKSFNDALADYDISPSSTVNEAGGAWKELLLRADEHRRAHGQLESGEKDAHGAEKRRAGFVEERAHWLEGLSLPTDSDHADEVKRKIRQALEQRDQYKELREKRTELTVKLDTLTAELAGWEHLFEQERSALQEQRKEKQEIAGGFEELNDEIVRIEDRVQRAKQAHSLEDALAARERERESHAREVAGARERLLGNLLVEHLRETSEHENLPAVFHRAHDLFIGVTNGRFELTLDPRDQVFGALDTQLGRRRALDELSDGTRLQLHVCVRIAFIEQQERGLKLPLLLDELLANSDDERASHLVDAFVTLQKSGRQLFYFTAQYDEILKWRRISQKRGVEAPPEFRMETALANARDLLEPLLDLSTPAPALRDIPDPEGLTRAEFGERVGAPRFNPHAELGSLHLWYVISDLPALAELLRAGRETWGQLKAIQDAGINLGIDADYWERIEAGVRLLEEARSLWSVGRGRPVTEEILEQSGVTPTFWDRVIEIAVRENWDAEKILKGAAYLPRIRSSTLEAMRETLIAEGCLSEEDPLAVEEVRDRLLRSFSDEINRERLALADIEWTLQILYEEQ